VARPDSDIDVEIAGQLEIRDLDHTLAAIRCDKVDRPAAKRCLASRQRRSIEQRARLGADAATAGMESRAREMDGACCTGSYL
jgi:hypothetical protein